MTISVADGVSLPDVVTPSTPPGGVPGYNQNTLLSGGQVAFVSGYDFVVQASEYTILGVDYASPQTDVTLSPADATNDRIDVFALDDSGAVVVLEGIPAATPVKPVIDPATQLELTFVYVEAAVGPVDLSSLVIYDEGTEWTDTKSGAGINLASTNNPHTGTVCVEGTSVTSGQWFQFEAPGAGVVTGRTNLVFYVRSKASWPGQKIWNIQWYNGTTPVGAPVAFRSGSFSFTSAQASAYQLIVIPLSLFAITGLDVSIVRFTVAGGGGSIGFYFDTCDLQGGLSVTLPTGLMRWRGTWSATNQYEANDVVVSNGNPFVALVSNTNVTPVAGAIWAALVSAQTTQTLTDAATIAWNGALGPVAKVTLADNRTLGAPTNLVDGGTYILRVIQDGTGSRTLAYNAVYKWPGGTDPVLSTGAGAIDILTFVSDGTNMYGVAQLAFAT